MQTTKKPHRVQVTSFQNTPDNYSTSAALIDQFRQAMQAFGIYYIGEIIADGKLHRFHIEGQKRGSLNGAYTLHLDNKPAGWFLDFTTGRSQIWSSSARARLSYSQIQQIKEAQRQREAEKR